MRVLLVHPNMRIMGGGERVAIHTILALLRLGTEVTLACEKFDHDAFEEFYGQDGLFDRVRTVEYAPFKPHFASAGLLYRRLFYQQRSLQRVLATQSRFDLVIGTQDIGYMPSLRSPMVQYCYFTESFKHLEGRPSSPFWRLYYLPARIFYRNRVGLVGTLLSTSEFTKGFIRRIWKRDSTTVYPPCPVELYKSVNEKRENSVVTVGRIVPDKRMHLFIEVARKMPLIKFQIIGSVGSTDDPYYNSLLAKAPSNLSILLSPLRKAKDVLGRAKVYLHCMENEHFGITIVEAMAAGCVPVVHDSGGPREIVTEEVGFRWRDIEEAVTQVSALMMKDDLREALSRASARKALLFSDQVFESSLGAILNRFYGASDQE